MNLGLKRGSAKKQAKAIHAEFRQQVEREEAMYQGILATLQNAMNYAVARGKGPPPPPGRS